MPIYEYQCKQCGYKFEQLPKITEKSLHKCPKCRKNQLVKLVSNPSFQLKGTGWYVTDFKNKDTGAKKIKSSTEPTIKNKDTKAIEKVKNTEKK